MKADEFSAKAQHRYGVRAVWWLSGFVVAYGCIALAVAFNLSPGVQLSLSGGSCVVYLIGHTYGTRWWHVRELRRFQAEVASGLATRHLRGSE